ncbi:transient receptor potential cation channel protein painless-like [Planococcus citri]|uniref:transient receptor potential cation channel protein painless-like n=1 Tax=Planococcus citri TaxID=170843 RepID=UPI0031F804C8
MNYLPERTPSSIFNQLLFTLKNSNLDEFKQIIAYNSDANFFDVNYFFDEFVEYNDSGTLLDIACRSTGKSEFVQILLSNFANVNVINKRTGKAPIHEAVEKSDIDTVKVLIKKYWYSECDVNLPDQNGNTALHLVIKLNKMDFMKTLLQNCNRIDINVGTWQNATPLHLALRKGNLDAAKLLLEHPHVDLNFQKDSEGRTCRQIIQDQYPQQFLQSFSFRNIRSPYNIGSILFSLLKRQETELFENLASEVDVGFLNETHNGCQTYLQCACDLGLVSTVNMLLSKGVNPNKMAETRQNKTVIRKCRSLTPAMLAARNGFDQVLELLIENSEIQLQISELGSVLHSVMEGMFNKSTDQRSGHHKCLQLILNKAKSRDGLDLNFEDHDGYTVLFMATILNDDQVIKSLIYAGARFYQKNHPGDTYYLMINSSMLSEYLDSCISSKNESPFMIDCDIIIDYKTLVSSSKNLGSEDVNETEASSELEEVIVRDLDSREVYEMQSSGMLECSSKKNRADSDVNEMEIFTVLNDSAELREHLKHPVLVSFLYMKWHQVEKYYKINFFLYLLFCWSLSLYVWFIYEVFPSLATLQINLISLLWWATQIFYIPLIPRVVLQFFLSPQFNWNSLEDWFERIVFTIAGYLLYFSRPDQCCLLTAVVILVSWIELVFLLGKHPSFATEIAMFKKVAWNFMRFLFLYSGMILAFAFSFYILMRQNPLKQDPLNDKGNTSNSKDVTSAFNNPITSIFKSFIMLTGEFDMESVPLGSSPFNSNHLVFILFVFLIGIVLYNLLNGLAINDTRDIREDAELVGIASEIKLISDLELIANRNLFHCIFNLLSRYCPDRFKRYFPVVERKLVSFYRRLFPSFCPRRFTDKISLWPKFPAGSHIRVSQRRNNAVSFPSSYDQKQGTFKYSKGCDWKMHPDVIKRAKEILQKRKDSMKTGDYNQQLSSMNHNQFKFDAIEKCVQLIANEVIELKSQINRAKVSPEAECLQDSVTEIRDLKHKIGQLRTHPDFYNSLSTPVSFV